MLFIHTNMGFWSLETALGFGPLSASGGYFFESRSFEEHFVPQKIFYLEIDESDSTMRISEKNGTRSVKNHGQRMSFHMFYKHSKSFIEFWPASAFWPGS